jgi:serine/threonine-protein kinase
MSGSPNEPASALVAGKYQLTRMIGKGGMGSVHEGIHITLGTRVAVKFIEAEYADSTDARSRFENEARAAAKLQSKHVVSVFDHGVMPDGRPYIVMEFLQGEPLDRRLERLGRLAPMDTVRIVSQVARALARAHAAGIVHRDLKPENVFLVWDEEDSADIAKVVDFGIAKFTNASMGVSSSTRTGSVLGTPYYMSPEQARGLRTVDARTDLWALGVITYRAAVGELPFFGEALGDLLVKICTAPLPVPSHVSPGLPLAFDAWFARALERDPEQRFQTAAEMADALSQALLGHGGRQSAAILPAPVPVGGGAQSSLQPTPAGVQLPSGVGTPQPAQAYATPGGYATPGYGNAPSAAGFGATTPAPSPGWGQTPAQLTDASFTQTPYGVPRKGSGVGIAVVAGLALIGLLGIGGVSFFVFRSAAGSAAAQPSASDAAALVSAPQNAAPSGAVAPSPEPSVAPAPEPAPEVASAAPTGAPTSIPPANRPTDARPRTTVPTVPAPPPPATTAPRRPSRPSPADLTGY